MSYGIGHCDGHWVRSRRHAPAWRSIHRKSECLTKRAGWKASDVDGGTLDFSARVSKDAHSAHSEAEGSPEDGDDKVTSIR